MSPSSLTGRRVVVTGANSGIGLETARALARRGADVVLAVRDVGRGVTARDDIARTAPAAVLTVEQLDLASLASVRAFAERAQQWDGIDLLVNNAGIMAPPLTRTTDGFESQFGVNHLGHFALTGQLLPQMRDRAGARVVTLSSLAHHDGQLDFSNLDAALDYRPWAAYQQSKLANLLFALELHRRLHTIGAPLLSVAAHPGLAATELFSRTSGQRGWRWAQWLYPVLGRVVAQSPAAGALPVIYAATAPDVRSGDYFGPRRFAETRGGTTRARVSPRARDEQLARQLWAESERLTGVRFDLPGSAGS